MAPHAEERQAEPEPYWISNSYSRQLTHKWRSEEQAILVGTNTVIADDSKLDVRQWTGKSPRRIILDKSLRILGDRQIFKSNKAMFEHGSSTLILTEVEDVSRYRAGVDYGLLDFSKNVASEICRILHEQNINSVLIEGGAKTLKTFIDADIWDEARMFTGPFHFKSGIKAPVPMGKLIASKEIGSDGLKIYEHD